MGNSATSAWLGMEPDKPDPISGMSPRDIYHVQKTWAPIHAKAQTYGMEMFLRFFRKDPKAQAFFKRVRGLTEEEIKNNPQFQAHVQNVMAAIDSAVASLRDPLVVEALSSKLADTHIAFKVDIIYFEEFKEVIIDMLKSDMKLSEYALQSWSRFIDFIYKPIMTKLRNNDK